jgi:hypothetical protein
VHFTVPAPCDVSCIPLLFLILQLSSSMGPYIFLTIYLSNALRAFIPLPSFFNVHGSAHLGNVYVQLKVQLDVLLIYILYSSLFLALYVLGAIAPILRSTNCSLKP